MAAPPNLPPPPAPQATVSPAIKTYSAATGVGRGAAGGRISGGAIAAEANRPGGYTGAAVPRDAQHHLAERVQRAGCCSDTHTSDD